jgi:hypothetical protein
VCCVVVLTGLLSACGGGSESHQATPSGNRPPRAAITSPPEGATFKAGEVIAFAGSASDTEDGSIPDVQLAWSIELHLGANDETSEVQTGGASGSIGIR